MLDTKVMKRVILLVNDEKLVQKLQRASADCGSTSKVTNDQLIGITLRPKIRFLFAFVSNMPFKWSAC